MPLYANLGEIDDTSPTGGRSGMYNYRRGWAADLLDDFFFVVFATFIRNETKQVVSYGTCTIGGDEDESMGSQGITNVRCGGGRRPDPSPQLIWCNFVTTSTRECVVRLGCVCGLAFFTIKLIVTWGEFGLFLFFHDLMQVELFHCAYITSFWGRRARLRRRNATPRSVVIP